MKCFLNKQKLNQTNKYLIMMIKLFISVSFIILFFFIYGCINMSDTTNETLSDNLTAPATTPETTAGTIPATPPATTPETTQTTPPATTVPNTQDAVAQCVSICTSAKLNGTDMSNGPCLAQNYVDDWVCDVAHLPRQPCDNLPENQCQAYRDGNAHHFVEVNEGCEVIKVY